MERNIFIIRSVFLFLFSIFLSLSSLFLILFEYFHLLRPIFFDSTFDVQHYFTQATMEFYLTLTGLLICHEFDSG